MNHKIFSKFYKKSVDVRNPVSKNNVFAGFGSRGLNYTAFCSDVSMIEKLYKIRVLQKSKHNRVGFIGGGISGEKTFCQSSHTAN
jgi:hypothetical protein